MTNIYAALSAVQKDLSETGIAKAQHNKNGNYWFRGIDDVLNALAPILSKHGVVILPRVLKQTLSETKTSTGKPQTRAVVRVRYSLCASDGSTVCTEFGGEANDSSDKSLNKAFTAAFKYMVFQTFCIPIHGQEDADNENPEAAVADVPTVSDEQLEALLSLMQYLEADDQSKFRKWVAVPLHELPVASFDVVHKKLAMKVEQIKAKEQS